MPVVENGVIRSLSVSQANTFDSEQHGGCPTRWYIEAVEGLKDYEESEASKDGTAGHDLLAHWLKTGEPPKGRTRMGKAVSAVIAKGELKAQPGQQIETRFDGQAQRTPEGKWIPVDRDRTFWLGGLPWDGFVDQRWHSEGTVYVLDHKFTSDIAAKEAEVPSLVGTIQMPLYALEALRVWPKATQFELIHHYVSRKGTGSKLRREPMGLNQLRLRAHGIADLVERMKAVARLPSRADVPFHRKSCSAGYGCPHQAICPHFKERKVQLTAEELAMFGTPVTPQPAPAVVTAPLPPVAHVVPLTIGLSPQPLATPSVVVTAATAGTVPHVTVNDAPAAGAIIPPDAPSNSKPEPLVMPACADCGADLNPENSSKKRGGGYKHIGCAGKPAGVAPANAAAMVTPSPLLASAAEADAAARELAARELAAKLTSTLQIQRVVIELGPQTLEVLKALVAGR